MRKLCLPLRRIFLSLLLAPAAWALCATLAWADPACVVAAVRGVALLEHNGARSELAKGQAVEPGDSVKTEAGARIRLHFADGSEVSLGESSELHVATVSFDQAADTRTILLDLPSGLLRAAAAKFKTGSRFEIRTPVAYSAVRGTHWIVMARSTETRVYVQEGRVAVGASFATSQFSKLVEAGHWVSVTTQNGVGAVQDSPAGATDGLVEQTEAALESSGPAAVQTAFADSAPAPTTGTVMGTTTSTLSAVGGAATSALKTLGGAATQTLGAVGSTADATLNAVGSAATTTLGAVGSTTTSVANQTFSTLSTTTSQVTGLAGSAVGALLGASASSPSTDTSSSGGTSGSNASGSGSSGGSASSASGGTSSGSGSSGSSSSGGSSSGSSSSGSSSSGGGSSGSSSSGSGGASSSSSASAGSASSSSSGSSGSSGSLGGAVRSAVGAVRSAVGGLLH